MVHKHGIFFTAKASNLEKDAFGVRHHGGSIRRYDFSNKKRYQHKKNGETKETEKEKGQGTQKEKMRKYELPRPRPTSSCDPTQNFATNGIHFTGTNNVLIGSPKNNYLAKMWRRNSRRQ